MKLFNLSEIETELVFQKRPSSKIKSPYVSDAVDKNGNNFLVHTPGLGLGGQYGKGDTITVTQSNPKSKTDYAMQCVDVTEDGYSKVTVGANPAFAEKIASEVLKRKLIKNYSAYALISKPNEYKYNGDLYLKSNDSIIGVEVKNVVCATYDPNKKIDRKDSVFYDKSLPFKRSGIYPNGVLSQKWNSKPVVSSRSLLQLDKMVRLKEEGYKFLVMFIVNRGDCDTFKPNWQRDKEYSKMLNKAHSAGVDIQAVGIEWKMGICKYRSILTVDLKKW